MIVDVELGILEPAAVQVVVPRVVHDWRPGHRTAGGFSLPVRSRLGIGARTCGTSEEVIHGRSRRRGAEAQYNRAVGLEQMS